MRRRLMLARRARRSRLVHARFAAISVRASFLAGMWVGLILGVVVGAILGAVLVWFAGTVLDWQRDLGFTLGVTRALLPFGDQIAALRWISATWWAIVPAGALVFGLLGAAIAGSIGALLAAAYNRTPRHAGVLLEVEDARELQAAAPEAERTTEPPRGAERATEPRPGAERTTEPPRGAERTTEPPRGAERATEPKRASQPKPAADPQPEPERGTPSAAPDPDA